MDGFIKASSKSLVGGGNLTVSVDDINQVRQGIEDGARSLLAALEVQLDLEMAGNIDPNGNNAARFTVRTKQGRVVPLEHTALLIVG